jgi:hypothetical protein
MAPTLVFPYSITLEEDGRPHLYPAAEVGFPSQDGGWFTLFLLVDSGAVTSALPKSDASAFGIDPEAGRAQAIVGIEGIAIKGWEHVVRIRLGDELLDIPLLFVDSDKAPRVLGREGIFDRFTIMFEEAKQRTGFLDRESPPAQAAGQILDAMESA